MKFEIFLSRRLRLSRDNGKATSPSIYIAVIGIALALVIMMLAICIVLGFKHEIRDKVMGFDAHITVNPTPGYGDGKDGNFINLTDSLRDIITTAIPVESLTLSLDQPGMLKTDNDFKGIIMRGMAADNDWTFLRFNLSEGEIPDYTIAENKNKVVISRAMASALGLNVNDKVHAYFFLDNNVRARNLEIAGIYDTHFSDYDNIYLFASIALPQGLNDVDRSYGTRIELHIADTDNIDTDTYALQESLAQACYNNTLAKLYTVDNVHRTGMLYFNWLELLDMNVVVILILMAVVSGFTLISSLFILILERVNMIGVMKALGATDMQINRIFIYMAEKLVLIGLGFGNVIGIGLVLLQDRLHLLSLDPDAYYLNYVPIEINWWYIILLNFGIIIASYTMLLLPSRLISKISPSTAIRYE